MICAVMDNTALVLFLFLNNTHYPRMKVGEPMANVQDFNLKAIGVISHIMIFELSDRIDEAVFLYCENHQLGWWFERAYSEGWKK